MTEHSIGVDISKSHLDVFDAQRGAAQRFENSARGCQTFETWLGKAPIARVVYEPTGPYHRNFEERFSDKLPLVKVNPRATRAGSPRPAERAPKPMRWMRGAWRAWGVHWLWSRMPRSRK
ncbi:MAG: hypothetical protein ACK5LJ_04925 [Paracoccus sp. (in: a-proteobacteria)]